MAPQGGSGQSGFSSIIFLVLIVVVFYFFMIRPQMKRQKELKNFRETLKKGDKIITNGGIYGKIMDVKEQTLTVEISDNVLIKVDKGAVVKDPTDIQESK
ncbi:MAG: preprotein translocase subunit YajC [Bacteroidia bacterium]|nr:preprotein translocase subunit YajC [Bacteroidia bacterium]